jgi:hypothetical protein
MSPEGRQFVSRRVGWLLTGTGAAIGIVAAFVLVSSAGPALNDTFLRDPCATPCTQTRDLEAGNHIVFERIGSSSTIGPLTTRTQGATTLSPDDVEVTTQSGRVLDVVASGSSQTIDRSGTIYRGVVGFRVPEGGRYRVSIDAPHETRVIVAPGLGQTFLDALPGLVVAALGVAAGIVGLVVLVIDWTRRRSARSPT